MRSCGSRLLREAEASRHGTEFFPRLDVRLYSLPSPLYASSTRAFTGPVKGEAVFKTSRTECFFNNGRALLPFPFSVTTGSANSAPSVRRLASILRFIKISQPPSCLPHGVRSKNTPRIYSSYQVAIHVGKPCPCFDFASATRSTNGFPSQAGLVRSPWASPLPA